MTADPGQQAAMKGRFARAWSGLLWQLQLEAVVLVLAQLANIAVLLPLSVPVASRNHRHRRAGCCSSACFLRMVAGAVVGSSVGVVFASGAPTAAWAMHLEGMDAIGANRLVELLMMLLSVLLGVWCGAHAVGGALDGDGEDASGAPAGDGAESSDVAEVDLVGQPTDTTCASMARMQMPFFKIIAPSDPHEGLAVIFRELTPGSYYNFKVRARNAYGYGPWSQGSEFIYVPVPAPV